MIDSKTCEYCGEVFQKDPRIGYAKWGSQRACSKRCAKFLRGKLPNDQLKSKRRWWEHRQIASQMLGRSLLPGEEVHHINKDSLDNRPENLKVVFHPEHMRLHATYPSTKTCVICGEEFTPHPTKRKRQQTCASPACKSALIKQRWREGRYANRPKPTGRPKGFR